MLDRIPRRSVSKWKPYWRGLGQHSRSSTGTYAMDTRLVRLIHDYQDAVRCAVEALEATGIPRPKSTTDWIGYDVPGTGELATGGRYFIHGFGCAVKTPEFCVDFDFGEHGEIDGFDFHRMENFARNHLQSKYGFADPTELHLAIKASCDAGEMIDSGYILWYIKPELQGESNQNVDEPSDRPESPTGRCDNG